MYSNQKYKFNKYSLNLQNNPHLLTLFKIIGVFIIVYKNLLINYTFVPIRVVGIPWTRPLKNQKKIDRRFVNQLNEK